MPGTLFPHSLIDQILPTLTGTQWQLLCVIVRQTQGWFDPQTNARKTTDWLSHSQLRRRTGRSSDAVCHAVDALVRNHLIEVHDERGRLLDTPQQRQHSRSRLYYRLAPNLLAQFQARNLLVEFEPSQKFGPSSGIEQTSIGAGRTTTKQLRPNNGILESRFVKAETTKESLTKETAFLADTTREHSTSASGKTESSHPTTLSHQSHSQTPRKEQLVESLNTASPVVPALQGTQMVSCSPEALALIESHQNLAQQYSELERQSVEAPDDVRLTHAELSCEQRQQLQAALERYGYGRMAQLSEMFFRSDLAYIVKHGRSLPVFLSVIHILNAQRTKKAHP